MRLTYRTVRVLSVIGEAPGASNREVAEGSGIADQGQISKLLARLERLQLIENTGGGQLKGIFQCVATHQARSPGRARDPSPMSGRSAM